MIDESDEEVWTEEDQDGCMAVILVGGLIAFGLGLGTLASYLIFKS